MLCKQMQGLGEWRSCKDDVKGHDSMHVKALRFVQFQECQKSSRLGGVADAYVGSVCTGVCILTICN